MQGSEVPQHHALDKLVVPPKDIHLEYKASVTWSQQPTELGKVSTGLQCTE